MALKRSKPRIDDNQLDLFAYARSNADNADPIRDDGRETLAAIPPQNGQGTGNARETSSDVAGSRGEDGGGVVVAPAQADEPRINGAASARPGLGDGAGEIHPP